MFLLLMVCGLIVFNPIVQGVSKATIQARFLITEKNDKKMNLKSPLTGSDLVYRVDNTDGSYISNYENRKIGQEIVIYSYRPTVLPRNVVVWLDYKVRGIPTKRVFSDQKSVISRVSNQ